MEKSVEHAYLRELSFRCRLALRAYDDFRSALVTLYSGNMANVATTTDHMWLSLHAFLTQCANVSKMLWPVGRDKSRSERGEHLRGLLNITDDSPLHERTLRDKMDHFDERLDEWVAQSKSRNLATWNVFEPGSVAGIDVHDYVGVLDPVNMKVTILGKDYEIMPLVEATARLLREVEPRLGVPFYRMPPDSDTRE